MKKNRKSVLFLGDANIDLLFSGLESPVTADCEVFCSGFSRALGGSTALAAAVFARLGGSAAFCGLIGDDENGRFITERLTSAGVDTSLLHSTSESPTGITVNLQYGRERSQVTCRGTLAICCETDRALQQLDRFCHIHISGPYGMPVFLPQISGFITAAKTAGKTVSIDTQWDPSGHWEGLDSWLPQIDLLFVNEHEAGSITGENDPKSAWQKLRKRTACPVVKLGADGVIVDGKIYPAIDVPVVDTTGAGDSFAAGFLFAVLEQGKTIPEAATFASCVSAVACTYAGGDSEKMNQQAVAGLYSTNNS